jgi:hypothetical protein
MTASWPAMLTGGSRGQDRPARRGHLAPPVPGLELRVAGELRRRAQLGAGDARLVQRGHEIHRGELDAFLPPVQPHEVAGLPVHRAVETAGEVPGARALDLDHPRAEVGELAGGERAGHGLLQRDDRDAG